MTLFRNKISIAVGSKTQLSARDLFLVYDMCLELMQSNTAVSQQDYFKSTRLILQANCETVKSLNLKKKKTKKEEGAPHTHIHRNPPC